MPFCPKCRYEYREGIEKCPDCDVKLKDILPEEKPVEKPEDEDWVSLGTLTDEHETNMIKSVLESAGVPVWIRNTTSQYPGVLGLSALGERTIMVPASRVNRAEEALRNARTK